MRRYLQVGAAMMAWALVMAGCATTPATPADKYRQAGEGKYTKHDYVGAVADFNHLVALEPKNATAWFLRGKAKDEAYDYPGAIADLNQSVELDPSNATAYYWRGWAKDDADDHAGAMIDLDQAVSLEPKNAETWSARGWAKEHAGDHAGAIADLNQALELDPANTKAYYRRGRVKVDAGDDAGAMEDFNHAVEMGPKDARAWAFRGSAKVHAGDYASALDDLNRAIELDPKDTDNWFFRGLAKVQLNDNAGAIADFNRSLELDPQEINAYHWRGVARLNQHNDAGAVADLSRYTELKPKDAQGWYSLGMARADALKNAGGLDKASADDFAEITADLDKSLALDSTNAETYMLRGMTKLGAGDIEGARADLNQALKLHLDADEADKVRGALATIQEITSTPEYVFQQEGIASLEAHKFHEAVFDFDKCVEIEPKNAQAWFLRGLTKLSLNDDAGAMADLNQSLKLDPTDAEAYFWRAGIERVNGDFDAARADLVVALTQPHDDKFADRVRDTLAGLRPDARVTFKDAKINGQPINLILDTGSTAPVFTTGGAKRLGMEVGPDASDSPATWFGERVAMALSQPVQLTVGGQAFAMEMPVGSFPGMTIDGFIAWPEVQDNILVFDPEKHTVSSVAELPAEAAGWVKMPIRTDDILSLETSLADGKTWVITVDTGDPGGVRLAPARWQEWQAHNPGTTTANKIELGTLVLTNVPVSEEIDPDVSDDFFCRLGLAALDRMDLVVDAKGGFAYVKPRPPTNATPTATGIAGGNNSANNADFSQGWTVAGSVVVNGQQLLLASAEMKSLLQDYAGAMAEVNQVLQIDPKSGAAYFVLGGVEGRKGDYDKAIADLTRAIQLAPKSADGYLARGTAERKKGDNDAAVEDVKRARELNPSAFDRFSDDRFDNDTNEPKGGSEDIRMMFSNTTVNGKPVKLALDTGAETTVFMTPQIDRLGLKVTPSALVSQPGAGYVNPGLSEQVILVIGAEAMTVRLPVITIPPNMPFLMDGMIGWPDVRDNILVFDSEKGTVAGVDKLPAETAGWLKLPVREGKVLLLEAALPEGKTGAIFVDTGYSEGVALPPAQWKEWRAAHPQAPSEGYFIYSPSEGHLAVEEAWADEIKIGNLTLTDVPVREASVGELTRAGDLAAVLGMYALTRMDMVVDAKDGLAYVRPKPGPGPAYPGFDRPEASKSTAAAGDWKVDGDVQVKSGNLELFAVNFDAKEKVKTGDFDGAIAGYTQLIETNPKDADAYHDRALVKDKKGDFAGAVADFDRALELDPKIEDAYLDRGMTKDREGDYAGAVADYDRAITLKPDDANYPRLYREVAQERMAKGKATPDFAAEVAGWKDGWAKSVGEYLAGELEEAALLAAAQNAGEEPVSGQLCEANYFIGTKHLLAGDMAGARDFWEKSVATGERDYYEYGFATDELARTGNVTAK